jgi:hypothetical protein
VIQLKAALSKLTDCYNFEFLCNHDTLYQDLRTRKAQGKVDLVMQFCDEV